MTNQNTNILTETLQNAQTLTAAFTATDAEITNAIATELAELKAQATAREAFVTNLAAKLKMTEAEVEAGFGAGLAPKIDLVAKEAELRANAKQKLDAEKRINTLASLQMASEITSMLNRAQHEMDLEKIYAQAQVQQPKSSIDKLVDMMIAEKAMNYAPAPAPVAPTPAPAPTVTEAATPSVITTRKELGNELRSISAAARGDRAMLHADSVEHPFTGNCKKWGASLFQEIADRAYTRSDYWKNK